MAATPASRWPSIPVAGWQDTRDTLHLYTQVIGKVRLANEPIANHWWNSTLYLSARGLTTSVMPHRSGPAFQVEFDFIDHRLDVTTVDGNWRSLPLEPRPVAEFYAAFMRMLDDLDVGTAIWPVPVEIPEAIPFPDDRAHACYDPEAVRRFWLALIEIERVFKVFRSRFVGKASPVHYFWGAIDLAHNCLRALPCNGLGRQRRRDRRATDARDDSEIDVDLGVGVQQGERLRHHRPSGVHHVQPHARMPLQNVLEEQRVAVRAPHAGFPREWWRDPVDPLRPRRSWFV